MHRLIPSLTGYFAGLVLCSVIAGLAYLLGATETFGRLGIGPLTLAILVGVVVGNGLPERARHRLRPGIGMAQTRLLRLGVMLYGFNLSFQQIAQVGTAALLTDIGIIGATLSVGWIVGTHWLKLDRETVILTSAGSAICGAAAILATEPVLGAPAHKTSAAVGSVVLFGSLGMIVYPFLYHLGWWQAPAFGVYVGATVHEVAQVVAIGKTLGGSIADTAVIVKMMRVLMLAPFLVALRFTKIGQSALTGRKVTVPWFALGFIALTGFNSLQWCSPGFVAVCRSVDTLLLAVAMAALGVETTFERMRQAGRGALVLGAVLFVQLILLGGGVLLFLR